MLFYILLKDTKKYLFFLTEVFRIGSVQGNTQVFVTAEIPTLDKDCL